MISFYDWVPSQLDGSGHADAGGRAQSSHAAVPPSYDEAAQRDPAVQAKICEKIQHAVDISDVFNKVAIHRAAASAKTLVFAVHRIARYCRLRRQDTGPTRRAARWTALLAELQRRLALLDAQALTDIAWSLAVLQHREARLLSGICHQAFDRVEDFAPSNLAITSWSFATLSYRDDLVMKRLNRQALERLHEFEAQSLANMAWSLATMRFKDDVLLHHLAKESLCKVSEFSPQHVANTSWAYATLGRRASTLFEALQGKAVELLQDESVDFVPLDLALCAWSFAWLDHAKPDAPMLHGIACVAMRRLDEFSTQQLANMLWGFDHANYENPQLYSLVGRWCCAKPVTFWQKAAGEELVSIMTALKPHAAGLPGWQELEQYFVSTVVQPLAAFLRQGNTEEGYSQGLRKLRTYHAGALYTSWMFRELGISYLGDGNDARTQRKVDDLLRFYLSPPEPRWLPDGYDDDDEKANRAEIPALLELLDVKRRVQPSSHFIALHLAAELVVGPRTSGNAGDGLPVRRDDNVPDSAGQEDDSAATVNGLPTLCEPQHRRICRAVPTRPPRRSGLCFVRGEKFEEQDVSGDEDGPLKTSTLRDYRRKHHAEVLALTQISEVITEMDASFSSSMPSVPLSARVSGWVELFVPHYPCSSCIGALVQFCSLYPLLDIRVGHDDWRHWMRKLTERWDPEDKRQHALSINARQLRELDNDLGAPIPEAYRAALRRTLGDAGIASGTLGSAAVSGGLCGAIAGNAQPVGTGAADQPPDRCPGEEGGGRPLPQPAARRQTFY